MLQDRSHTREMNQFGGLLTTVPLLGWFFIVAAFASLGLPGLAHFPAEFQIFLATLREVPWATVVIIGIVITAGLYLKAISEIFLGASNEKWKAMPDLNQRELITLIPLIFFIVILGVAPSWVLDVVHQTTIAFSF